MRDYEPDEQCDCEGSCYDCSVLGCVACMAKAEKEFGETSKRARPVRDNPVG